MPNTVCIVSNGTYPLKRFDSFIFTRFLWMAERGFMTKLEEDVPIQRLDKIA